jgi:hypothetical protein
MSITAYTLDRDDRLNSYCVTAKCTYRYFIALTEGAEGNLNIQRSIIKGAKAYATLRSDLKRGCVLPPIVLAAKIDLGRPTDQFFAANNIPELSAQLSTIQSADIYIIDGLQRTNAIRQTMNELEEPARSVFLDRELRLELWLNIPFGAIAYRMLLLNAGQRPMSVKHQVEVLSSKLVDDLETVQNLHIFRVNDTRRRVQPGQFQLAKLAQAFQAWLQGQPNLDLRNSVMEELLAESAIEVLGHSVADSTVAQGTTEDGFSQLVTWIVELDMALGAEKLQFLGNETVLLGLAAAVGALERNETLSPRVWPALGRLLELARDDAANALGLTTFESLRQGIDSSKTNVGVATRDMVFSAFKEFIRGAAETDMNECWRIGAARD